MFVRIHLQRFNVAVILELGRAKPLQGCRKNPEVLIWKRVTELNIGKAKMPPSAERFRAKSGS